MLERKSTLGAALVFACALAAVSHPSTAEVAAAPTRCGALVGLAIPPSEIRLKTGGGRIISATLRAASGAAGSPDHLPEYCDVRGQIAPLDPRAPLINFGVALPTRWNHMAIQIGGNGLLGFIPWLAALNRNGAGSPQGATAPPDQPYPLAQGYATYGDDSGHVTAAGAPPGLPGGVPPTNGQATMGGPPPMGTFEWVASRESWLNFSYEHIRKGHDAAIAVMRRFYGATPRINYFMGESHGGREAMEAVGRYPEDYDGALVSVPLVYLTELWLRDFRNIQASSLPGGYIPAAKLPAIERETIRQCDALDGLQDGVVENYTACNRRFDPDANPNAVDGLRCPDGGDTSAACLSDAQLTVLRTLRGSVKLPYRLEGLGDVYPGAPAGSESNFMWLNGRAPPRPGDFNPALSIMRVTLAEPTMTIAGFEPSEHVDALRRMAAELDAPTDWSRFFARGGKVIYHSAANDYLTNSRAHIAAFKAIEARSGAQAVALGMRFYVTPGGDHASRSFSFPDKIPQPRQMDLVGALEAWVEKGKTPPDALPQALAELQPPYTIVRRRPLCRYPRYPRPASAADPTAIGGFVCAQP